jgi:hypothetical protein
MDLVTLITACTLNVEPKLMHVLIWRQSGGEPWSFSVPGESLPRVLPTLQDGVREAQVARPEGDRVRVGLTGLSINPRSVTALVFAPCPNVTLAARQLTQLVERCNTTSKPDRTYCAIAAYRGSWARPDIGFADAVRATVEDGNAPNLDLPKDAYFDASDIASDIATRQAVCCSKYASVSTRRPHARLVKCIVPDQVNEAEWHIRWRRERRSSRRGTALA